MKIKTDRNPLNLKLLIYEQLKMVQVEVILQLSTMITMLIFFLIDLFIMNLYLYGKKN